jgi:hypothetical protein
VLPAVGEALGLPRELLSITRDLLANEEKRLAFENALDPRERRTVIAKALGADILLDALVQVFDTRKMTSHDKAELYRLLGGQNDVPKEAIDWSIRLLADHRERFKGVQDRNAFALALAEALGMPGNIALLENLLRGHPRKADFYSNLRDLLDRNATAATQTRPDLMNDGLTTGSLSQNEGAARSSDRSKASSDTQNDSADQSQKWLDHIRSMLERGNEDGARSALQNALKDENIHPATKQALHNEFPQLC